MLSISAFIAIFLSFAAFTPPKSTACHSYEPSVVTLTGTLVRKRFLNEAAPVQNDKTEIYWVLKLDSPMCVTKDESEPDLNPRLENVKNVQLVLNESEYNIYRELMGKKVQATGTLFGAHSAHHHTRVLLNIQNIKAGRAQRRRSH